VTLGRFEQLLKRIDPALKIRQRRYGDVAGLFVGKSGKGGYICRLSKGELNLHGYRDLIIDRDRPWDERRGNIRKRGRKTIINFLRSYRWVTNHKQRSMLSWGIDYPNEEVKGLTGYDQHSKKR
jgi:hypothetical protein